MDKEEFYNSFQPICSSSLFNGWIANSFLTCDSTFSPLLILSFMWLPTNLEYSLVSVSIDFLVKLPTLHQ